MTEFIHFAHPYIFLSCGLMLFLVVLFRQKIYKPVIYKYPLANKIAASIKKTNSPKGRVFFVLRLALLVILALLSGKLQIADNKSKVHVEGRDIVMALDVSGSMQLFDDISDPRMRIDVAKQEALRFIEKRENDQIGLVLFGSVAVSRCPLTLDKHILKEIINETKIGVIPPDGTFLATGLATAINRLKNSKSKSKVIILLTDGAPTGDDLEPDVPIKIAKELGIKVYTVGVGAEEGGMTRHPLFGVRRIPEGGLNKKLLEYIAIETGGQFFEAKNPYQMKLVYDTIDKLETTEYETIVFSRYQDYFEPLLWAGLIIIVLETLLKMFVWFGL